MLATYARLDVHELYNVGETGLAGGAGRALVFLNFSTALVAIPVIALASERLSGRFVRPVAAVAVAACAFVAVPGVVEQDDLDAKALNVVPALGVAAAVVLTVLAARRTGLAFAPGQPGDPARIAAIVVLAVVGAPWISAELGFFLDLPGVLTEELRTQPGDPVPHHAVHLGHHHGMDGVLLAVSALVLSRRVGGVRGLRLRGVLASYLSLMLVYGVWNVAQDGWLEQVVKRGTTDTEIPNVLQPELAVPWLVLLALAGVVRMTVFRPRSS